MNGKSNLGCSSAMEAIHDFWDDEKFLPFIHPLSKDQFIAMVLCLADYSGTNSAEKWELVADTVSKEIPQGHVHTPEEYQRVMEKTLPFVFSLNSSYFSSNREIVSAVWHVWYSEMMAKFQHDWWVFMNYGFAYTDPEQEPELRPEEEEDRYFIQLYDWTARLDETSLRGLDVLEVGCGRGGGAAFLASHHQPNSYTAIDYCHSVIDFCKQRHKGIENLNFVCANAENMDCFPNGSFDIIISVESSHHYASMDKFLSEIHRLLRSRGKFLLSDFRDKPNKKKLFRAIGRSRLGLIDQQLINSNVLKAMELDNESKLKRIWNLIYNNNNGHNTPTTHATPIANDREEELFYAAFLHFAGIKDHSVMYSSFAEEHLKYYSLVLQKKKELLPDK